MASVIERKFAHTSVWLVTAFALLAAGVRPSAAEPGESALSEYQKQGWHVEDGLPQGNVRAIVQAPNGSLLIGTGGGMVSFDGQRFIAAAVDSHDEIANEPVNSLLFARNGDLWIGTDDHGVVHRSQGHSVNVSEKAGLTDERVRALFEDAVGVIWVATQNGVERMLGERVEYLSALGIVPGDVTAPFAPDGLGGMFIVTAKGLFHWTAAVVKPVLVHHRELGPVTAVYRDSRGRIWVGAGRGAFRLVKKGSGFIEEVEPGVHGQVVAFLSDRQGNIWIGSRGHGICRLSEQGLTHWSGTNGLADDTILSLSEDLEGNLWVGMLSGGLSRWRQTVLVPYGQPEGFPKSFASTVLPGRNGDLWLGTWGQGVYRLRQGSLHRVTLPGAPPLVPIRALSEDRQGNVWIGTWYSGLYRFDGISARRYLTGSESFANAVSALLVDRQGSLWIGTYRGLLKYERGFPEPGREQVILPGKLITCLREDVSGGLLVGTSQGLYRLRGAAVTALTRNDGLSNDAVISISVDRAGAVWVGAKAGGLDRIVGQKATRIPAGSGLPPFLIFSVLDDGHGVLWMSSPRGVLRVRRNELYEVSEGRRRTMNLTLLGKNDGMRNSECGGVSQPPAAQAQDGSLWFATAAGFVHTDPSRVVRPLTPPVPGIGGLTIDHVAVPISPANSIAPGKSDVDFQFEAVRLSDPGRLEFRTKLEGYDPDWTTTRERHMLYKRLTPGHYRFVVGVRDQDGPWSDKAAAIDIEQRPYFYQNWWSYALALGLLTGVIAMIFRWRFARAKNRVSVILEERNRIAREWHDTLMADFAALAWQIEATQNRLEDAPREAAKALELTRTMVKHCQAEARRIIWDLRAGEEPLGLLSEELSKVLCGMGPRAELETQMQVEGEERRLPPVCVHHLVCIGQEAVTNALQHGAAHEVKIRVTYGPSRVSMTVRDDGRGFLPPESTQTTPGHFGLAVMHERAKKIGGALKIQSAPGAGTEVWVDVPAPVSP